MKMLFISQRINDIASGARVVSRTNLEVLKNVIDNDSLTVFEIKKEKTSRLKRVIRKSKGYLDGLTPKDIKNIYALISSNEINTVYIDSSYFGILAKKIKKSFPNIIIIVFYHDILVHWWKQTHGKNIFSYIFNLFLYSNSEKKCAINADMSLVMTDRDSKLLSKIYNIDPNFICITPLSLAEEYAKVESNVIGSTDYLLFVGVDYKPNIDGLDWFIKNVQPEISIPLIIVGKGTEKYKNKFENKNIKIEGTVDDLSVWYQNASACIIPLFSGSGMKVKTAEAFAYGKKVFATDEGLTGYEIQNIKDIHRCNTKEEFINAIKKLESQESKSTYSKTVRNFFEQHYSLEAATQRMRGILNERCIGNNS